MKILMSLMCAMSVASVAQAKVDSSINVDKAYPQPPVMSTSCAGKAQVTLWDTKSISKPRAAAAHGTGGRKGKR